MQALQDAVSSLAEELDVPGVAVAVLHDGDEQHAFHGVTSVTNPLAVDERTLFLCGSTTKTFTATAIVRLAEQGLVDLDAPVRTYVPEFRVSDAEASATATVTQILNHTSGWDGDFFKDTGSGDDALERYVAAMATLQQVTPPGEAVSYNNSAFAVAGRVVEKVTGKVYEDALSELVLEPLELRDSFFFPRDIMTRRFAVDHQRLQDGGTNVLPYGFPRATNCVGGIATTTHDLISWARFHLDATGLVAEMQRPTVEVPGWSSGDGVGLSWLLGDVAEQPVVGHGGATFGQLSLFKMVPARGFALVSFTNAAPVGNTFNRRITEWAWSELLGAPIEEPQTTSRDDVTEYCGRYETVANIADVTPHDGGFSAHIVDRPEVLEELGLEVEEEPPVECGFTVDRDRFVAVVPPYKGSSGFFVRDDADRVTAMNILGRHFVRTG
ncbi:MAG TPA: serine hydrolase domain-containing protein [Gaiellaceae bacterium]